MEERIDEPVVEETPETVEDVSVAAEEHSAENQSDTDPAAADAPKSLEAELAKLNDRYVRQAAEFQNYRRRTAREFMMQRESGEARVLTEMIDVLDDLERSLQAAESAEADGAGFAALKTGVELVYAKFSEALVKFDVERIEAVGKPFDENLHEALMQQPGGDDAESGTVLQELQPGYRRGEKVLRHAKVIVAA
ncbi:MAG: nucleotide exchange factor GrpE [Bacteroidota bacterium]